MKFAFDENCQRIQPATSGQRGFCPFCKSIVIGKCGEVYAWHWQHAPQSRCDPWYEPETKWHRDWKSRFPDSWQEVIIEKQNEKHIADIKTSYGLVIEFQNSPISRSTILQREVFYENMIWVINAQSFNQNFVMRSVVKSKIRDIEEYEENQVHEFERDIEEEIDRLNKGIITREKEINSLWQQIEADRNIHSKLQDYLINIEELVNEMTHSLKEKKYLSYHNLYEITATIMKDFKERLVNLNNESIKLQSGISDYQGRLHRIANLEKIVIEDIEYFFVPYSKLPKENYKKIKAIQKATRSSIFPNHISITSELEFVEFGFRQKEFDFVIDLGNYISSYQHQLNIWEKNLEEHTETENDIRNKIHKMLSDWLTKKCQEEGRDIALKNQQWEAKIKSRSALVENKYKTIESMKMELKGLKIEIESNKKSSSSKVMKENKGSYTFYWKHERKSWQEAQATIFFDTGSGYLLQKINSYLFKKVEVNEFLDIHNIDTIIQ